jgi:single-strand DNA-binding protein
MFGDLNRVELLGNVTNEPELKYTSGGTAVMNLGIATNRRVKKGDDWVDEADFHNIVIWANLATNLSTRVRKGTRIYIAGRLQTRSWEDDAGKKNYRTEIHVINSQDVILIARYEGAKDGGFSGGAEAEPASARPASNAGGSSNIQIDPDDLPF